MTVTAQRRQLPVVPLTLTSDLHLQQSPQQLSPTLSSPVSITQVRSFILFQEQCICISQVFGPKMDEVRNLKIVIALAS